jgi:nicotinamidase-related amidase
MLKKESTGLVVVDIQGKLARVVHESEQTIASAAKLIKGIQILNLPILWLEQNPEKIGTTVPEIAEVLTALTPIPKFTFDACGEAAFLRAAQNLSVRTWLVCGIETHICVYQTAMSLKGAGSEVELVCDAVSSRTAFNKDLAISKLTANGVGITSLEMCLYELLGDCRAAEFKEILRLIK